MVVAVAKRRFALSDRKCGVIDTRHISFFFSLHSIMSLVLSMKRIKRPVSVVNRKSSGGEISSERYRFRMIAWCVLCMRFSLRLWKKGPEQYVQDLQIVSGEASQT